MPYPNFIAAWSRRGRVPGASGTPRLHAPGRFAVLIMLAALAIRLASLMPGVPVLHWHGSVAMVHVGGGIPHDFGDGPCGGHEEPSRSDGDSTGGAYYSPAAIPLCSTEFHVCLLDERPPLGGIPVQECVCPPRGATPPGPTRGPPAA